LPNEQEAESPPVAAQPGAKLMARRFRGFLPVAIDVETGGFNNATDALLEIAATLIDMDENGVLRRGVTHSFHVIPFAGSRLDPASLAVTGIDPYHPLRPAIPERDALQRVFREIRHAVRAYHCRRAILVGHNASFDLGFINAAVTRAEIKRNPFHPFSCFDTVSLAGAALGQTVLAKVQAQIRVEVRAGRMRSIVNVPSAAVLVCALRKTRDGRSPGFSATYSSADCTETFAPSFVAAATK